MKLEPITFRLHQLRAEFGLLDLIESSRLHYRGTIVDGAFAEQVNEGFSTQFEGLTSKERASALDACLDETELTFRVEERLC